MTTVERWDIIDSSFVYRMKADGKLFAHWGTIIPTIIEAPISLKITIRLLNGEKASPWFKLKLELY